MDTTPVTPGPRRRRPAAVAALAAGLCVAALAACSAPAAPPAAAPQAAAPAAATGPDTAAGCAAVVDFESVIPPGVDPDGPPPAASALQAWSAQVGPSLTTARANLPADLTPSIDALLGAVGRAATGTRIDVTDPALNRAGSTVDSWVFAHCGYPTLDVTSTGGKLGPVPATLAAGPAVVRFTNAGTPSGFVALVARLKDPAVTAADLDSGKANFDAVAQVVGAAQPTGPEPAYTTVKLTPGPYVVSVPLGSSPQTITGTVSAPFTVS